MPKHRMGDWRSRNGGVRKYKEDEFKYHVMKGAVKASEIATTTYGYHPLLLILIYIINLNISLVYFSVNHGRY